MAIQIFSVRQQIYAHIIEIKKKKKGGCVEASFSATMTFEKLSEHI